MAREGVVSIGLKIEHSEALKTMLSNFSAALKQMENTAERVKWDKNVIASFEEIKKEISKVESSTKTMFDELNSQKLKADSFKKYQEEASSRFGKIEADIKGLTDRLEELGDGNYVSKLVNQFNELHESVKQTYVDLGKVVNFTSSTNVIDLDIVKQVAEYEKAINKIKNLKDNAELPDIDVSSDENIKKAIAAYDDMYKAYELLEDKEAELKNKLSVSSGDDRLQAEQELYVHRQKMINQFEELEYAYGKIKKIDKDGSLLGAYDDPEIFDPRASFSGGIDKYIKDCSEFIQQNEKMVESYRETQSQLDALVTEFKLKNGAIHVPIEIDKINETHKNQLMSALNKLQEELDKKNIIAKVKLTLDDGSSKGRKKNADFDQQQKDGQDKPAVDLSPSIAKAYREGAKIAEESVKAGMAEIQKAFKDVPVTFKPDTDAFKSDLKAMINDSLKSIAEDTTGIKVNEELEKLVANLKEVSSSLSGNESFKFGLDEASIERITTAIRDMADMIQRAFGVASNDDISAQWTTIESKFKGVAGEEGKLLKGNKEHKIAIQELAVEYKKYLDMGGKNDLSELTTHKQTIKNIAAEYESLGKAAQEAAQQQEKVAKKPSSTKVSSEEKEAINAVSRENKKLETQAGNTGTALDNESKVAQAAAERFAELAEKKKAATDANLELGIAAEMTTKALKEEMAALKEAEQRKKSNKKAVDEDTYESNALDWQSDIKQYLLDSGEYANIYESEISRAENGTVKFTATVKTMGDELNEVEGEWKKYTATVNSSGEISSFKLKDLTDKKSQKIEKEMELLRQLSEQADGEEKKSFDKSEMQAYVSTIIDATQALETFNTKYSVFVNKSGGLSIIQQVTKDNGQVETFTAKFRDVESVIAAITDETKSFKQTLEESFDGGSFATSIKDFASKAQEAFDKFTLKHEGNSNWSKIAEDVNNVKQSIATIDSQGKLNEFNQSLSNIAVKLNNIGKDNKLGKILDENKTFGNINEVRANIDSLFASMGKVNEKSIRITGTDKLTAEVKSANGEIRKMAVSLGSDNFARFVDKGIVEFGRLRSVAEGVFKGIQSMVRIYLSPQDFIRYFRQGFDAVREIDTAMTELKKVSDAPLGDIVAYFDDATESAKKLGSTVEDMISATADWSRLGYNLPDSRKLGEVAVLYKNVGDGIDIDTANESLVSTIQGFQLQASDAMAVIDSFNEVSNNYAISSSGIGEALKRSAAAFNAANTDLNQSIALITAGNEIVQSPEKVGTMWQTVSARIRGTKSELEELGEATDDVLSTSKLQSLVKAYTDVDIMKSATEYKDIYTIISEIGEKWKDLKDVERAALLEGLAGKKQSNTLAAVLNNYERLEEIYQTAENSMGSAQREQDRYAQSLQYSLDQLTAHGEEFWNAFINKDDVKDFINLLNGIIEKATKVVDIFGSIPTVAGILGGFASIKNVGRPKMFGLKIVLNCRQL